MDYVDHWNELFFIYKRCSRITMLMRNGHKKWVVIGMSLYAMISMLAFFTTYESPYNVVVTVAVEFATAYLVGYVLSWKNGESIGNAASLSVPERELYARYRVFSDDFKSNQKLSEVSIDNLVEWYDARFMKMEVSSIFQSPLFILLLSSVVSLFLSVEYIKNNSGYVLAIVMSILIGVVPFLWLLHGYMYSDRRKYFNICKFLKWVELDKKFSNNQKIDE
ncbi:hypothetical protein EHZ47_02215 [Aeromonas jandaei]|uniref:hypothetical protein n=1 Tax=Aeromonas jandaei TaxID=650 RepID=UPI000F5389BE|nr:hypothetical protein [Aeromonas jandaei]RQM77983.1 hypothetical protein EHZ47_02215 [Aeromonas jandaei]